MTKSSHFKPVPPELHDAWYETPPGNWTGRWNSGLSSTRSNRLKGTAFSTSVAVRAGLRRQPGELTGACVTGADIDENWLEYARSRDSTSRYCVANALSLPFEGVSFSHVLSITAVCFTSDWKSALAEAVRVAGERIAIGLLNRNSLLWWKKGRKAGSAFDGAEWITPAELLKAANALPLEDIRISTAIYLPSGPVLAQATERMLQNRLNWGSFPLLTAKTV